jgi:hypothetical protein
MKTLSKRGVEIKERGIWVWIERAVTCMRRRASDISEVRPGMMAFT